MTFSVLHHNGYVVITFNSEAIVSPEELRSFEPPHAIRDNFAHKGVILSGRGPIWLYCFLCHYYHPTKFVATYDPRLQGAVVVQSHGSEYQPGEIIPISSDLIN